MTHLARARELSDAELINHALVCYRHCEARHRAMTSGTITVCRQWSFTCAALRVAEERGLKLDVGD